MKIKEVTFAVIGVLAMAYSGTASCAEKAEQFRFICGETVACGSSMKVQGDKVILDRSLITRLVKKPTFEVLGDNIWVLIYFINIGDKEANSAGIDLLALIRAPGNVQIDDDKGLRPLTRALTAEYSFWTMLATKPMSIRKKVIHFIDVNKQDYAGHLGDYEEDKQNALRE